MRYLKITILHLVLLFILPLNLSAQTSSDASSSDEGIVEAIMDASDNILIVQPDALTLRLLPGANFKNSWTPDKKEHVAPTGVRFRVQVFSDNNRQNAKANAEYRKRLIEQRMPEFRGYVSYESPYWRVRVGDFENQAEAQAAMKQIKSKFPSFAPDVRIVRVRVNN